MINKRGEETRQLIKNCDCALFASKGFKQVTMKDICEATKLSRGGLYCHYGSTQEIFKEIINDFMSQQGDTFSEKIAQNLSAIEILKGIRDKYEAHHNVKITDEAITTAVTMSVRYITDRFLPDKAMRYLHLTRPLMSRNISFSPILA